MADVTEWDRDRLIAEVERLRGVVDAAQGERAALIALFGPEPDGKAGTLTGDLATDMARYGNRMKARAEAAEAEVATLREQVAGLMSEPTRRLMAQEYLIDMGDCVGQDLTRHANAMAAALRAALTPPTPTEGA